MSAAPRRLSSVRFRTQSLQKVARTVLPLYRTVARNARYANRLARAIRTRGDVEGIIRKTIPLQGMETARVGFFLCYGFPAEELCVGTIIRSQGRPFRTPPFRAVAAAIIPFYMKLKRNSCYASKLARYARARDTRAVRRLVRQVIRTPRLHSIIANEGELRLIFRFCDGTKMEQAFF